MSRCKAISPITLKRCIRGEAHVSNGIAHTDGESFWAAPDNTKEKPNEEFERRIREAVTARIARIRGIDMWLRTKAYTELQHEVDDIIRRMHAEWMKTL